MDATTVDDDMQLDLTGPVTDRVGDQLAHEQLDVGLLGQATLREEGMDSVTRSRDAAAVGREDVGQFVSHVPTVCWSPLGSQARVKHTSERLPTDRGPNHRPIVCTEGLARHPAVTAA